MVRRQCAQRCDSENQHSAVAAKREKHCDSSGSERAEITMGTLM